MDEQVPVPPPTKPFPLFPVLLSLLSFLLLLSTGFLAYQNVQLQKQIVAMKVVPTPTPTPIVDPTANWKTYKSERFSIEFKYPPEYFLENKYENVYPNQGFINLYTQEGYQAVSSNVPTENFDVVEIGGFANPKNLSALEWAKSNTAHSNFTGVYTYKKIAGNDALSYSFQGLRNGEMVVLYHNNYIFVFSVMSNSVMKQNFDQILSTFTFTDQTPTPSTSYTCPPTGYVDCMPILDTAKQKACSAQAMAWYKANCPDFKGGAL